MDKLIIPLTTMYSNSSPKRRSSFDQQGKKWTFTVYLSPLEISKVTYVETGEEIATKLTAW